jgi:starvation-inducible outer membrane lipoprotein
VTNGLCVSTHYKIKSCCKRNYGKIISNVSAYISPIRLRTVAGTLAGERVRVSGWGRTSDSKYNFLIILYFNFKIAHIRLTVSKGRNLWPSEYSVFAVNTCSLYYDMQSVRTVQTCMAVLCEPVNWCY